jgi:hypothetical protein
LNRKIDLKSAPKRGNKKKNLQEWNLKEIFCRGKTKLAYFGRGKNLFIKKKHKRTYLIEMQNLNTTYAFGQKIMRQLYIYQEKS